MTHYQADLVKLGAASSLREAIVTCLHTFESFPNREGWTLGDLMDRFEDYDSEDIWRAAQTLIAEGGAYVTVPLEIMDLDQYVFPITWAVGRSTVSDIEAEFGPRHAERSKAGLTTLCYDLYVENVWDDDEEEDGEECDPTPPQPYSMREAANPDRPTECGFPYSAICPPEALQIEFDFNEGGVLESYRFQVAERNT